MNLTSRYTELGEHFSVVDFPSTVANPHLLLWNTELAAQIGVDTDNDEQRAAIFSGNQLDTQIKPVALGYSGHQFGHFSPCLGDGRAHLLGAIKDHQGKLWDIQLKGSGATPFSRGGDGRCALGPAIREYVMSEAMNALGVATTRCLAVVASGETVYRHPPQAGAIVTRVARSHIRVGSFQYLASQGDIEGLKKLAEYVITCHYPQINSTAEQRYIDLLAAVIEQQIALIISWMRVGFIHGVMNTDNTLISGETIDYGPCAMINQFDFDTVFSSIDKQGRYAFGNQANIANWNCARLAESLLPLFADDQQAIATLSPLLEQFSEQFNQAFNTMWQQKLGLSGEQQSDHQLVTELLQLMKQHQLDYTNTFNALTESLNNQLTIPAELQAWSIKWMARVDESSYRIMRAVNPVFIPRNHNIEIFINEYEKFGQSEHLNKFLRVLKKPYDFSAQVSEWCQPPADNDRNYQTFCGT
ncbi:YdiU family protein [Pseudoalteromonas mariniglutinosa]|uniref:protein adenylyltransferase SelO n=1 Tax=Pseudoalteromonas mariniglutinosa TaxID=206042 RepID=UPI00384E8B22